MFETEAAFGLMTFCFFAAGVICLAVALRNFRFGSCRRGDWQMGAATALFAIGISTASITIIFWKIAE